MNGENFNPMSDGSRFGEHFMVKKVLIEMKPSKLLKGEVGVFVVREIKKDSVVVEASQFLCEKFIPWNKFNDLDPVTKRKVMDYCSGDKNGFYVPPDLNYLSIAWHLNHSCKPNVGFSESYDFVAMRNIKKGEELFWDYCFDESNPDFKMKCSCGSKKCRGIITGNDWKMLIKSKSLRKYISSDIKKLAANESK